MNTVELKNRLIHRISEINDVAFLRAVFNCSYLMGKQAKSKQINPKIEY